MKVYEIQREYESLLAMNDAILEAESVGADVAEMKADIERQFSELENETSNKMENIVKLVRNLESEALAYKTEIDRMTKMMKSRENQVSYIKDNLIKPTLLKRDSGKIQAGLFMLSLRNSKAVNITNGSAIPTKYKETVTSVKVLKKEIGADLKLGFIISGAELVENKSVQIK